MKKKLSLFLLTLLCLSLSNNSSAQTNCNGYTLNTDWRNYVAPSGVIPLPPFQTVNNFDWSANFFTIYEDVGGTVTPKQLQSPFWPNTAGPFNQPNVNHFRNVFANNGGFTNPALAIGSVDIWPEDGWELLYKDFGTPTDAYDFNPSFALYNKYTGIARIFYFVENMGQTASSTARIGVTTVPDRNNALLSFTETELSALNVFERHLSQALNYAQSLTNFWLFTEFPMAFDPCVCRYPSDSKLDFKFEIIEQGNIVLEGNAAGFSTPTIYNNGVYTPQKSNIMSNSEKTTMVGSNSSLIDEVNGYYESLSSFKDNLSSLIGEQDDNGIDKPEALSEVAILFNTWQTVADLFPRIKAGVGIIDFLIAGGKSKNEATKEPTPVGYETELKIKLNGTINTNINLSTVEINTPGANGAVSSATLTYNNPLGVFNLLESPPIEYAEYSTSNQSAIFIQHPTHTGPGGGPVFNTLNSNTSAYFTNIKIREYHLVPSTTYGRLVNYIINPLSQLSAKQIKAAILFKFSNLPDYIDTSNYVDYIAGPVEFGITISERDGLGFVHRMRMLGYEIASWPKGTARLKDITFRTNYADLACLEDEAFFYCWDNTNPNVNYLPETWLKLDIQLQRNDDYAIANPNETQDVMMVLKYDANENTQNTTIPNLKYTANMVVLGQWPTGNIPAIPIQTLDYEILPNGDFQPNSLSWTQNAAKPWNGTFGITKQHTMTPGPWSSPINKKYGTLIVNASNFALFNPPNSPKTINAYNLYIHPTITNFTTHHTINVGNQVYSLSNWNTVNNNTNWQQNLLVAYIGNPGPPIPYFGSAFSPIVSDDLGFIAGVLGFFDPNNLTVSVPAAEALPFIVGFTINISPLGSVLLTDNSNTGQIYVHGYKNCAGSPQNFQATQANVTSFCTGTTYEALSQAKSEDFSGDKNTTITDELTKEGLSVYPNPNNGVFVGSFNINGTKNVSLFISDLSGKVIETIIDNKTYTTGNYKQNILLDNISNGIYICTLKVGDNVLKEKVVIIK